MRKIITAKDIKENLEIRMKEYDFSWSDVDWSLNPELYKTRNERRKDWETYYKRDLIREQRHNKYLIRKANRLK